MPKAVHRQLKRRARKLAKAGKLRDGEEEYIYGTLRKIEKRHRAKGGKKGKYLTKV